MYITWASRAPAYPLHDRGIGQNLAFEWKSHPWAVQTITVGQCSPDRVDFTLSWLRPTEVRRLWAMFVMPFWRQLLEKLQFVQGEQSNTRAMRITCCVPRHFFEAHQAFIPIKPDVPENQWATNIVFVMQLAPDVRKKLQKLKGFEGMNRSQFIEYCSIKIFGGRKAEQKGWPKQLLAMLRETDKRNPRGRSQRHQKG